MSESAAERVRSAHFEDLLGSARDGDTDAFVELLARAAPDLRRSIFIDAPWRSSLSEDDVVQVTFTEAFLRLDRFVGSNAISFQAWLKKIAQNNIRAAIRGLNSSKRPSPLNRRGLRTGRPDSEADLLVELGVVSATPSRAAARDEMREIMSEAIKKLPPDYAAVINLYYFEGLRGEELALRLRRSRGAASMLLARARDRLAELVGSPSRFFTDSP